MDAAKAVALLPDSATCNICFELFKDPVTLDCGHNYCVSCITNYFEGSGPSCPQCKEVFTSTTLRPNRQLGNIAWLLKQFKLQDVEIVKKQKQGLCEEHQQPLVLFCKDDGIFICSGCEESPAHCHHLVVSMELATQEYKYEIKGMLDLQKLRRENMQDSATDMQQEKQNLVRLMEEGGQKFSLEYKELFEQIKTIQNEQLGLAKSIDKEIEEELSKLYKKRSTMKKIKNELEKKFELPPPEFLQDIKQVLSKCRRESYERLETEPPALKEKLWVFCRRNLFLQNTLRRCHETLALQLKVEKASVILDPVTAFSQLLLSEDQKRVIHGPEVYSSAAHFLGFDKAPCVLGSEGFTTGRHCWDVEITSQGDDWALGVVRESVNRKGDIVLGEHEGIWALQPEDSALLLQKTGTFRIRVYLLYEAGHLEFFDGSSRDLIAHFRSLCFSRERIFPFFMMKKTGSYMKIF
ncbi:E3 ubiquitin-protein ligase TRIM7-like [Tiliqua scincoides]|uniref:E3 ubiquitin-protein ligase TRIM7-like n=1 Tax=Tiliqua scincoides TaxID=71010 RepID=UPI00346191A3